MIFGITLNSPNTFPHIFMSFVCMYIFKLHNAISEVKSHLGYFIFSKYSKWYWWCDWRKDQKSHSSLSIISQGYSWEFDCTVVALFWLNDWEGLQAETISHPFLICTGALLLFELFSKFQCCHDNLCFHLQVCTGITSWQLMGPHNPFG